MRFVYSKSWLSFFCFSLRGYVIYRCAGFSGDNGNDWVFICEMRYRCSIQAALYVE